MASKAVTDIGSGIKKAAEAVKEKFCVVCGMGSHRTDWQNDKVAPACDSHSKEEVATAVKAAQDADKAAQAEATKAQTPAPPASEPSAQQTPPTSNPPTTPTT